MKWRSFLRMAVLALAFSVAMAASTGVVAAGGPSGIALILDLDANGDLLNTHDYAGYGGLQLLSQLGLAFTVEPSSALDDLERLKQYQAVVMPANTLSTQQRAAITSFVAGGGIFLSGGAETDYYEAGVKVVGALQANVPAIAGKFMHKNEHPIVEGILPSGLPILIPPGAETYPLIQPEENAVGVGTVAFSNESGAGVVIARHGDGLFLTFGTNPFATAGYGMGMATEASELHYSFPNKPQELNKAFNWETARSIKQAFISEEETDLVWADELGRTVLKALLWAFQQQSAPVVWEWYWPYHKEFAASLQHDWDSGSGTDARVLREAEKAWDVKSALYILVPVMKDPVEAGIWFQQGWEVGLHADKEPTPANFPQKMAEDMHTISWRTSIPIDRITSIAHHYLRYYKETPLWWEEAGFEYDSSWYDMDWKQVFFTGTSRPFFIKQGRQILSVMELPSRNTEAVQKSNNGAYYLGQPDLNLAWTRLHNYVDQVARLNGHASMNVHPNKRANHVEYEKGFVTYIKGYDGFTDKNAWFARPIDVSRWYRGRSQVQVAEEWDGSQLSITLSTKEVTVPLPLKGYSLLLPAQVGEMSAAAVSIDGNPAKVDRIAREGQEFVGLTLDLEGERVIRVSYAK